MKVRDLTAAQRLDKEESGNPSDIEVEEDTNASVDDMFCTAAGAHSFKPSATGTSKLRQLLNKADRA